MATAVNEAPKVESKTRPDPTPARAPVLNIASLGSGLKVISRRTVNFTLTMARAVCEMSEFAPDRAQDAKHVARLWTAMERGTFLSEQVMIVTCVYNNSEYRMNGQHTASARLLMPEDYLCMVQYLRYEAETENDMRRLYASIDRIKARTSSNVVVSYLYDTPEWQGVEKRTLRLLAEGLGFWLWKTSSDRRERDADDRSYLLMTEHYALAKRIGAFMESETGGHVLRAPVIGAMFATFSRSQSASVEFWGPVRSGTGFTKSHDPRLTLRNALLTTSIAMCRSTADRKSVSREEMFRWCLHAWNAWRNGSELKVLRAPMTTGRPKVI